MCFVQHRTNFGSIYFVIRNDMLIFDTYTIAVVWYDPFWNDCNPINLRIMHTDSTERKNLSLRNSACFWFEILAALLMEIPCSIPILVCLPSRTRGFVVPSMLQYTPSASHYKPPGSIWKNSWGCRIRRDTSLLKYSRLSASVAVLPFSCVLPG